MDLEIKESLENMLPRNALIPFCLLVLALSFLGTAASGQSRRPELIRDTDTAEGNETPDVPAEKELNPMLSEQNLQIGNFYFKKKNYDAAIQRYRDAVDYQPDSVKAYEALTRAYEKKGEFVNAVKTCHEFIEKNPESPRSPEFRARMAKIESSISR